MASHRHYHPPPPPPPPSSTTKPPRQYSQRSRQYPHHLMHIKVHNPIQSNPIQSNPTHSTQAQSPISHPPTSTRSTTLPYPTHIETVDQKIPTPLPPNLHSTTYQPANPPASSPSPTRNGPLISISISSTPKPPPLNTPRPARQFRTASMS